MSFADFETGKESGNLVELYEFKLGGTRFTHTNAEQDVVFEAQTYTATPGLERSSLIIDADDKGSPLTIQLPGNNVFARLYIGVIPGELPEVSIRELHLDDPDLEGVFVFQGLVSSVAFEEDARVAKLSCRPVTSAGGRIVPRFTFQALCNHNLFDERCNEDGTVSEAAFEEFVDVESVSDRVLTVAAGELSTEAAGFWLAGFIDHGNEFRTITGQSGRVMTLDLPFRNDPTGLQVRILPGCDHIIDGDCLTVYNNVVNHSGSPYVAEKNPFEGLD